MRRRWTVVAVAAVLAASTAAAGAALLPGGTSVDVGPLVFDMATARFFDGGWTSSVELHGVNLHTHTATLRVTVHNGDADDVGNWTGPDPVFEQGSFTGALDELSFDEVSGVVRVRGAVPTQVFERGVAVASSTITVDVTVAPGPDRACDLGPMDGTSLQTPLPVYSQMGGVRLMCGSNHAVPVGGARSSLVYAHTVDVRPDFPSSVQWHHDIPVTLDARTSSAASAGPAHST